MTKKDFFVLLMKIFGLYSLTISLFSVLPNSISLFINEIDFLGFLVVLVSVLLVLGLFVLLIYKSEYVAEKLKLKEGFDDDRIEISHFNEASIVKLACILLGGFLVIDNLPPLLNLLYYALKFDHKGIEFGSDNNFYLWSNALRVVIGYLLLTNYSSIIKILIKNKNEH